MYAGNPPYLGMDGEGISRYGFARMLHVGEGLGQNRQANLDLIEETDEMFLGRFRALVPANIGQLSGRPYEEPGHQFLCKRYLQ